MVAIELASPGRPRISRKTIAQGRPGVLRWTCMLVCAPFCANCTRDRGCSAHPVFPAPSDFEEGQTMQASGISCREKADAYPLYDDTDGCLNSNHVSASLRGAKRR